LPGLEDVLREFAARAFLDNELKVAGLEQETVKALCSHPPQNRYLVSSFLPEVLAAIGELDPALPLGYLCATDEELGEWRQRKVQWVIPSLELADRELIESVHAAGKKSWFGRSRTGNA